MRINTEKEAEDFLEKNGLNVAKRQLIKKKEEINNIKIDFPWVMKISSKHIVHKAKIGGTIVNINNLKDAEQAFDKLSKIDNFEGILVQEMIIGEELIIGLKHTPEFNSVVMMGRGGGEVEKIRDISFRVCPITGEIAREMLREIKFYKTIKDKVNIKSIEKTLLKISNLSQKYKEILELDINPLIVNKKEAVAVDARILTNTL